MREPIRWREVALHSLAAGVAVALGTSAFERWGILGALVAVAVVGLCTHFASEKLVRARTS